jgi:hypothetical protein
MPTWLAIALFQSIHVRSRCCGRLHRQRSAMRVLLRPPRFVGANMQAVMTIGLDIAKSVFQNHGVTRQVM